MNSEHEWFASEATRSIPSFEARVKTLYDFIGQFGIEETRNHLVAGPFLIDLYRKGGITSDELFEAQEEHVKNKRNATLFVPSDITLATHELFSREYSGRKHLSVREEQELRSIGKEAVFVMEYEGPYALSQKPYFRNVWEGIEREIIPETALTIARDKYRKRRGFSERDEFLN